MRDRRAVSTALGYVLNLGIATLVVTGLLVAGGGYVEDERDQTVRTELSVIGQQIAGDIETVDRLGQSTTGSESTVVLQRSIPRNAVGIGYTVRVTGGGDPSLELSTVDPDISVSIEMVTNATLTEATFQGGDIRITYDTTTDEVVVDNG